MKRIGFMFMIIILLFSLSGATIPDKTSVAGKCMTCHKEKSPGLYKQWFESSHATHNVTCLDCHQAKKGEKDSYTHYDATIATLVTPKDCGNCHEREAEETQRSYHATAGEILDSNDAYMAHVAGGAPVAIVGCESCHGAKVEIDPDSENRLSAKSWPNSGIGRLNPDGSKGSCTACHTRHSFSLSQARQPESCSKCHLGPDHPQKEVYEESKHGNAFFTNKEKMNLDGAAWVVGVDYYYAPTCATCHMSATTTQKVSHDVGNRISWTLRPPISKHKENWPAKRKNMQNVCLACHGQQFVDGHYYQYDALVELYNEKFAIPSTELITLVKNKGILKNKANFSNKLEWIYWELWHHEGRRARHGASMMAPDYAWWHGIYDVAQHFYFKFIPEARKLNDPDVNQFIDNMLANDPMHQWLSQPTADLKKGIRSGEIQKIYEQLFQKKQ